MPGHALLRMDTGMFGFLGLFGRSREIQAFDAALRAEGLHPRLVPDAVKLTALRLEKPDPLAGRGPTAALLAQCMLGPEAHAQATETAHADALARRLADAVEAGDSADARLVLLTMEAGIIHPDVVRRHALRRESAPES